jgi:hypothetical protein
LLVTGSNGNTVFSEEQTVTNTTYFQTQWTPQYVGDYNIQLYFNQSYTVATTSSPIRVTSQGSGAVSSSALLGLSLSDSGNSGSALTGVLSAAGVGMVGCVVLFTRLRKNRNEFLGNRLGSGTGGNEGELDDEEE